MKRHDEPSIAARHDEPSIAARHESAAGESAAGESAAGESAAGESATGESAGLTPLAPGSRRRSFLLLAAVLPWLLAVSTAASFAATLAAPGATTSASPSLAGQKVVRLSTTTSTEASGLLGYLLPRFEAASGVRVNVIAVGTGKALALARNGDVDVTLVHARVLEDKFVEDGDGIDRRDVMYNDFVVAGPVSDPAGIKGGRDVIAAFRKIAASDVKFVSRGDGSGTEVMEQGYWRHAGVRPGPQRYLSAGQGMGEVLNMAAQLQAYTLSDRATYSTYKAKTGLAILLEGDPAMLNPYGIIAVNPARHKHVNYSAARQLIDWITSAEGQALIAQFKPGGEQVFFPSRRATGAR